MSGLLASAFLTEPKVAGGQTVTVQVSIANTTDLIDSYAVKVFGLDPLWVDCEPTRLSLFPGDIGNVDVHLRIPAGFPAGMRSLTFHASSQNNHTQFALATVVLEIVGETMVTVQVDPVSTSGGGKAQVALVVANKGNSPMTVTPSAVDPEANAQFDFTPKQVKLMPGEQTVMQTQIKAKRPLVGSPKVRVIAFAATMVDAAGLPIKKVETVGTFIQRPRIGRTVLSLLGLITAAAVFAAVLSRTFNSVVKEASVSDALVNEALNKGQVKSPTVPLKPGRISGTVVSSSDDVGIAGVQVDLFSAGDGSVALATAATGQDGVYAFSRLGAGTYRVKFSGAGFGQLFYPGGRVFTEGDDVALSEQGNVSLDPVPFGGRPSSVSGKVITTGSPTGAKVSLLRLTGTADPATPAQVSTIDVSADGSFTLVKVPSPGRYNLVVSQPGAATESRPLKVEPGQQLEGIEVFLRPGDGLITGSIFAGGNATGGFDIVATDGTNKIETVSLTEASPDSPVGSYAIRNLATPGLYTVTVSKANYVSQTRAISLAAGASFPADFSLVPNIGSIAGTVSGPAGGLGGVNVHLTGGEVDLKATTISQGDAVGTYFFDKLPVPGIYTITFSKPGYVDQVRQAPIDPAVGSAEVVGIDATLGASLASISGTVFDSANRETVEAELTLTNGTATRKLLAADEPPGGFSFANVTPGSYTLTAHITGAADVVQLITVQPSEARVVTLTLGSQASLSGVVLNTDGTAAVGLQVRLYEPAKFPTGPAIAFKTTDGNGRYTFTEIAAPADFVVAVFFDANATVAFDSELTSSVPGLDVTVGGLVGP